MKSEEPSDEAILAAVQHEQRRIGVLLHENLCQTLAGVTIQLGLMLRRLEAGNAVGLADLTLVSNHIHDAIDVTRSISRGLRSTELEGAGLIEALGQLTDAAAKEMSCEYLCERPVVLPDAKAGPALLRIAEEALANTQKHAEAKHVTISLSQTPRAITLEIRDDGKGFLPAKVNGRIGGIDLMRRRARAAGATLAVESSPGRGTVVSCFLPIAE